MARADAALPDPAEVAISLRAVLAAVDAGDVVADDAQRAYIAGAADALESVASLSTGRDRGPCLR